MMVVEIQRGTVEFVEARFQTKSPDGGATAPATLVGTTVRLAVTDIGSSSHTWLAGGWVGTPTTAGLARTTGTRTFSLANYPNRDYIVFVEVTAGSEVVIEDAYTLRIIG